MIGLAVVAAAASAWARTLAGPVALAIVSAGLFALAFMPGGGRTWPLAIAAVALAVGATGWAGVRVARHIRGRRSGSAPTDGEGEPL